MAARVIQNHAGVGQMRALGRRWRFGAAWALALGAVACDERAPGATQDAGEAGGDAGVAGADGGDGALTADAAVVADAALAADAAVAADAALEPDEGTPGDPGPVSTADEAVESVDVFWATGGLGFAYAAVTPAAQVPLGLVRLGPDTSTGTLRPYFHHFSGYHHADTDVRGFSHLHFVGTGVVDYGNLRFLPLGDAPLGEDERPAALFDRYAPMDKATERGSPGAYQVRLTSPDVDVSLAASGRAGAQSYVFHGLPAAHVFFDVTAELSDDREAVRAAEVNVSADRRELTGSLTYGGPYTGRRPFTVYFATRLDPPPTEVALFDDTSDALDTARPSLAVTRGGRLGALARFSGVRGIPVRVDTGLSLVSVEAARAHREAEVEGQSVREVAAAAAALWRDKLGRVRVAGGEAAHRRVFFNALYNLWRMPTRLDDADGQYPGLDGAVHRSEGGAYYSDLSLWDTFRTLHPLYALIDVDVQRDVLNSLLAMGRQAGAIPRWPAATSESGGMDGDSANHLFAESLAKGVEGVDYAAAYEIMRATADAPPPPGSAAPGRGSVEVYARLGYIPTEAADSSASQSLELMYADDSLARLADALGHPDDAARLRARAGGWRQLLDPASGFLVGRTEAGELVRPARYDAHEGRLYTEGTAWQWRFHVPHDPEGLRDALGGPAALGEALETFFASSALGTTTGRVVQRLPDNFYWHGNEPDLHSVWLFALTDRPWRRDYWAREVQTRAYGDDLEGLPGNDDGGTMSAWWLWAALGLYPEAGRDTYWLGPPLFPRAEVELPGGSVLQIEAPGASTARRYLRGVTLNGVPVEGPRVTHAQLADGGTLVFTLRSTPPPEAR